MLDVSVLSFSTGLQQVASLSLPNWPELGEKNTSEKEKCEAERLRQSQRGNTGGEKGGQQKWAGEGEEGEPEKGSRKERNGHQADREKTLSLLPSTKTMLGKDLP